MKTARGTVGKKLNEHDQMDTWLYCKVCKKKAQLRELLGQYWQSISLIIRKEGRLRCLDGCMEHKNDNNWNTKMTITEQTLQTKMRQRKMWWNIKQNTKSFWSVQRKQAQFQKAKKSSRLLASPDLPKK